MNVTGKLTKSSGQWAIKDGVTGKKYELSGVDFPERVEGLTVRVVGAEMDSFGGGILDDVIPLQVQRWDVV